MQRQQQLHMIKGKEKEKTSCEFTYVLTGLTVVILELLADVVALRD